MPGYPQRINIDASLVNNHASRSVVFSNPEGRITEVASNHGLATFALEVEFQAIFLGLKTTLKHNWLNVIVSSDAEIAIRSPTEKKNPPSWSSLGVFLNILDLCNQFNFIAFELTPREFNYKVDSLARSVVSFDYYLVSDFPPMVAHLVSVE